jgi:hypothetical protein
MLPTDGDGSGNVGPAANQQGSFASITANTATIGTETLGRQNQTAANGDMAGIVTLSSGTASKTFATAYNAAPIVVVTPRVAGIVGPLYVTVTTAGFTVTSATGTDAGAVGYMVNGNPN